MLKRIPVEQLRLGMHLHALAGSWIDHPFWRTRFVLRDPADLAKLRAGRVREVVIDTALGLDVTAEPLAASRADAGAAPDADAPRSADPGEARSRARALLRQSHQLVSSMFEDARLGRALDIDGGRALVEEITSSVVDSPGTLISLVRLKSADEYTYLHSVAVCALMASLARQFGFDEAAVREAGLAGLMHDVGKAVMPITVLNKPGKLSDAELDVIRSHPARGHALLLESGQASAEVLDVCLHHHEKFDGSGYPERLRGEQISQLARMGAVCDVYDAVTSDRPYKAGWNPGEALRRMAQWQGHFDPAVFNAFVKTVGIYPVGSLVKLASGRLAVVTELNPEALLAPKVKVFYSLKSSLRIVPEPLDLAAPRGADRIVGCESPQAWGFKDLDALWAGDAAAPRP